MKLLDIIDILSDRCKIKLSIDGEYVGTFEKGDITYKYLTSVVKTIWPEYFNGENYIWCYCWAFDSSVREEDK